MIVPAVDPRFSLQIRSSMETAGIEPARRSARHFRPFAGDSQRRGGQGRILHLKSSDHDAAGSSRATQGHNAGRADTPATPLEQPQRPQNAPSAAVFGLGASETPHATRRDAPTDDDWAFAHVCAVHSADPFSCDGAGDCFSYCGLDLPPELLDLDDDMVLCVVCQDLKT